MDELHEIAASHGGRIARSLGSKTTLSPEQERILAESAVKAMTVVTRAKGIRSCVLRIRGASFDKGGYFPESSHPRTGLETLNDERSAASRARRTTSLVVVQDVRVEQSKPEPRFVGDPERPEMEGSHISYPIQHPRSGTVVAVLTLWCDEPGTFKEGKPADIYRDLLRNLSDAAFVLQSTSRSPRR